MPSLWRESPVIILALFNRTSSTLYGPEWTCSLYPRDTVQAIPEKSRLALIDAVQNYVSIENIIDRPKHPGADDSDKNFLPIKLLATYTWVRKSCSRVPHAMP